MSPAASDNNPLTAGARQIDDVNRLTHASRL
jgi:hypothetical protein